MFRAGVVVCSLFLLAGCLEAGDEVGTANGAVAVTWTNLVGVSAAGNDLTKTAGTTGWNAGAVSVETIPGDGYVQFTTGEATSSKMAGLSVGDVGQGRADIDFAIHLTASGAVGVYEGGLLRGSNFTGYTAGDLFRVEVKSGAVRYLKNGAVFYTSGLAPGSPLGVDTSLNTPGATIQDVELVSTSIHWQNLIEVAAAGDDLTKTDPQALWNAGASSVETLTGDGFVEFTATETTTLRMAGLGTGDASAHFSDIEYGIRLKANGVVGIYESGVARVLNAGSYLPGDTFRVEVSSGVVTYHMNGGPPLYTSQVAPTFPLRVDTSLNTPGSTLTDVHLVEADDACPLYQGNGPVCIGSFFVTNSVNQAAIAACAHITGDLTLDARAEGNPGMIVFELPALERVGGDISVVGDADLRRVRLPRLKEVGGGVFPEDVSAEGGLDLSRLRTAGIHFTASPDHAPGLPCLETAGTLRANNPWIPRLRAVSGVISGAVYAPALEVAQGVYGFVTAPVLTRVEKPDVSSTGSVGADFIDAPNLREIEGTLYYRAGTQLPGLETVGDLVIDGTAIELDLPSLTSVIRKLSDGGFVEPSTVAVVELPALESAGSVLLNDSELVQVLLPRLRTITGEGWGSTGLAIDTHNSQGSSVELPALESVKGEIVVRSDISLPVLTLVAGKLTLEDSMSAPLLAEVRGHMFVDATVTSVSFPSLVSAYSLRFGTTASYVQTIDLPMLTILSGGAGSAAGTFGLNHPLDLVNLSLPSLESTSGSFSITRGNDLASIDLPSLLSVGPSFTVSDNPLLPTCQAQSVVDQLLAAGWSGTVDISGNDDDGTCP